MEFAEERPTMDFLIQIVFEFIFDGAIEISKSKKVPQYIRYPLIVFITLFFVAVIGLMLCVSFSVLKENILGGSILIALILLMLIMCIIKFRKEYLNRKNKE